MELSVSEAARVMGISPFENTLVHHALVDTLEPLLARSYLADRHPRERGDPAGLLLLPPVECSSSPRTRRSGRFVDTEPGSIFEAPQRPGFPLTRE